MQCKCDRDSKLFLTSSLRIFLHDICDGYVFEFCEYVYSYNYVDIFLICGGIKSKGVAVVTCICGAISAVQSIYQLHAILCQSSPGDAPFLYVLALLYVCMLSLFTVVTYSYMHVHLTRPL